MPRPGLRRRGSSWLQFISTITPAPASLDRLQRFAHAPGMRALARVEQVEDRQRLVHAHQGFLLRVRLAQHQRQVEGTDRQVAVRHQVEFAPRRLDVALRRRAAPATRCGCGTRSGRRWCRSSACARRRTAAGRAGAPCVPSSRMISHSTAAGVRPARRARSQQASVCPARTSTPPGCAISGKTWPGLHDVRGS